MVMRTGVVEEASAMELAALLGMQPGKMCCEVLGPIEKILGTLETGLLKGQCQSASSDARTRCPSEAAREFSKERLLRRVPPSTRRARTWKVGPSHAHDHRPRTQLGVVSPCNHGIASSSCMLQQHLGV